MVNRTNDIPEYSDKELTGERELTGTVISVREAEACRHRLEKRWYRRLVFINFFLVISVCVAVLVHAGSYPGLAKQAWKHLQDEAQNETRNEVQDDIPFELQLLVYGIFLLVIVYLALYYIYAEVRSMSLRITERNFPEVYELIEEYARRLDMKQVPKAYVMQSNGVLNAFSSFLFRKQWIEINAEIFEVAYREFHDMDALGFVIAHEMAHIYYGHATLHYHLPIWFSNNIPLIGAIASRSREYSADRLAQRVSGTDGVEAMFMLMVDRHLYKMVDREDYLQEAAQQKGFFLWLVNLLADHPVLCKRIRALDQMEGSGELY